jgi:X-X-X-Leu-X-X-Gly heptad repeat protein
MSLVTAQPSPRGALKRPADTRKPVQNSGLFKPHGGLAKLYGGFSKLHGGLAKLYGGFSQVHGGLAKRTLAGSFL